MTTRRGPLIALTGLLVLVDTGLAALGVLVFHAFRDGNLTASEAATAILLGVSAVVGVIVLVLRARVPAWLRLAAVIIALAVIAIRLGADAVAGALETTAAAAALVDAIAAIIVTGAVRRRTSRL